MPTGVYIRTEKTKKSISIAVKKTMTPERRKQISELLKNKMTPEYRKQMSVRFKNAVNPERRKKLSEIRYKLTRRGKNSNFWKGGIDVSIIDKKIRKLTKYKLWREDCFKRDNYRCVNCGYKGYITVHHIKSFAKIIKENNIDNCLKAEGCSELWNLNNGITLCEECHSKTDNYKGRKMCKKRR